MFICYLCGHTKDELPVVKRAVGCYGSRTEYEYRQGDNCICGGYYEMAALCRECNGLFAHSRLEQGLCRNCREKAMEIFCHMLTSAQREYVLWRCL